MFRERARKAAAFAVACGALGCTTPAEGVREKANLLPLAYYATRERPPGYELDVLWPIFHRERAGEAESLRIFPLVARQREASGATYWNGLLLWNAWRSESESRDVLFPLYWRQATASESSLTIWPLYGRSETRIPDGSVRTKHSFAWPLFSFLNTSDDRESAARVATLGPFFGLYDSCSAPPRDTLAVGYVLAPLFALGSKSSRADDRGWAFLSLWDERLLDRFYDDGGGDEPLDVALASSWSRSDEAGLEVASHSRVFPLFTHRRDEDGSSATWIVPPLVRTASDPAIAREEQDILLGLFHHAREGEGPTRATEWRLLPLLWFTTRPDSRTHLVLPLYYRITDRDSDYLHVVPFYGRNLEDDGALRTTFVLAPLWIGTHDERSGRDRVDVLWPLSAFETSAGGRLSRVFPLWRYERSAARTSFNALLFFDRETSEVESALMLWPLFADRTIRGEGERTSILPIVDVVRHLAGSPPRGDETAVLWPLSSFRREGAAVRRYVFPFYWWTDDGEGRGTRMVWPFLGRQRFGSHTTWSFLWPLFNFGSDDEDEWRLTEVLWPLHSYMRSTTEAADFAHHYLFPLWSWRTRATDSGPVTSLSIVGPLYSYDRAENGSVSWNSLFVLASFEASGDGRIRDFRLLHALYRDRTEGERTTRSVPFLFRFERDAAGSALYLFHFLPIRW